MDVVDAIAAVETGSSGGMADVPTETITIISATVVQP
jgi:cyclophilin family peptidyl-prolyl cis-trans isomerase